MNCICQYSTLWQLKIEKIIWKEIANYLAAHKGLYLPCLHSELHSWGRWDQVPKLTGDYGSGKSDRGSLERNRSLKHCSTQWNPPAVSNTLDLCRTWEVSTLHGYFYFKGLENIFNPFALILLWSFHSALPSWSREHATKRTGANDEKYTLLSAFLCLLEENRFSWQISRGYLWLSLL